MEVLVLMYHQIVPDESPDGWVPSSLADPRYGVTQCEFSRQMTWLKKEGFIFVSIESLLSPDRLDQSTWSRGRPSVAITFDDGYATDLTVAAPILARLGIPATFFITTGLIGSSGMLSGEMVAELAAHPHFHVGGHGESHGFLSEMSEQACRVELDRSFERIRSLTGQETVAMSAPGGRISPRVTIFARKAGFRGLATSRPGLYSIGADPYSIPRLPILQSHTMEHFSALLDPRSRAHQTDRWLRTAKQTARSVFRILSSGKGG